MKVSRSGPSSELAMPSIRSGLQHVRRAILARSPLDWLFLLAVLFSASSYWVCWRQYCPDEPASIAAIYRAGDIENYPFIAALSRLQLGESVVRECVGTGVAPFPLWSSLPHGICLRLFGPAGFFVMDLIGFVAFYLACVAMLRQIAVSPLVARGVALLILSGGMADLQDLQAATPALQHLSVTLEFWGLRITRPFISSPLLCICLALFFHLLTDDSRNRRLPAWACLGVCCSLLLQADPYAAMTIATCTLLLFLYLLARGRVGALQLAGQAMAFLAAFLLCAVPYIVQRACELPDSPRRLGVFPVDRFHPLWLPYPNFTFLRLVWIAALGVIGLSWLLRNDAATGKSTQITIAIAGVCTASYFSLPLACLLLGKTLQVYHFVISFHVFVFLAFTAFALQAATRVAKTAGRRAKQTALGNTAARILAVLFLLVVLTFSVRSSLARAMQLVCDTEHMRSDFPEWRAMGPTYRGDFTALVAELSGPGYAGCEVVGTFDHQVYAWWATFRRGYSFLPDAALSTLPDSAIEDRLIALCRTVGMNRAGFEEAIHRRYINIFWLGHAKYQASQAHTFAPLADYTPEQQQKISKTGVIGSWGSLMPRTEAVRLLGKFDSLSGAALPGRLDLIILTNDESLLGLAPIGGEYEPAYANSSFRVWRRR